MNRQSTKKALVLPFIIMALTAIALVVVWFIFSQLIAGVAGAILIVIIILASLMVRQALHKMDNYVDELSGHISAGSNTAIKHLPIGMIVIDENEIIEAGWYTVENLPYVPPPSSLSGKLINLFVEDHS